MAINIKFDSVGNPEIPTIVLANRNGNKLGQLDVNPNSIELVDKFNEASEISFTVNKYIDGRLTNLWDEIVDFKLIYCKEWLVWFEIKVELDEATESIKTVFCTQLGQAELSQTMLYNIEINTEVDIERDDYEVTVFYDEENSKASLLHRLLEKAPHYSIHYVDYTLENIQRSFSFDDTSIYDAFQEVAEEIGCLFVFNSDSDENGMPKRTISVYDLQQNCLNPNCKYRGEFTDKCPKCNGEDNKDNTYGIRYGHGEDTLIFVTSDELASNGIQLTTDTDSVKNCFKLEAGDDLMTATIRNRNPNGTDYIWYFSEATKSDMPDELVERIESYDETYKYYYNEYESNLNSSLLKKYNALVEKYSVYYNDDDEELEEINSPIKGFASLMQAYYNTIDLGWYLKSGLMPDIKMSETNAEEQGLLLETSLPSLIAVANLKTLSKATADSTVLAMAKAIVSSAYKVSIKENSSQLSEDKNNWSGIFIVTNYSDEEDTYTTNTISRELTDWNETYIKQKIEKMLSKENTDDLSISGLFEEEYVEFCAELKKYALTPLTSFHDACQACIDILIEQGVGEESTPTYVKKEESTTCYESGDLIVTILSPTSIQVELEFGATARGITDINIRRSDDYGNILKHLSVEDIIIEAGEHYSSHTITGLSSGVEYIITCDCSAFSGEYSQVIFTMPSQEDQVEGVLYKKIYTSYYSKLKAIESEMKIREDEINIIIDLQTEIEKKKTQIQDKLNFQDYLGEELWSQFCAYRREDKYSNSNYISDGLNNAELFKRAMEFIEVAENEIFKSSELQLSISATLNNLLAIPKFKSLADSFNVGNWIRVQVDDNIYKLRLVEYTINYNDFNNISVKFSDVVKIKDGYSDLESILSDASSMASSYDSIKKQANSGDEARNMIRQWLNEGLNASLVQIQNNTNEDIVIDNNGLLGRSYSDITEEYSDEQIRLTHNIIAYTDNNWKSVKQAIGKHKFKRFDKNEEIFIDDEGYGMSAEFVTAGFISGSQIIGGEVYSDNYSESNKKGSYINLRDGTFSFGGGSIIFNNNKLTISSPDILTENEVTEITNNTIKTTNVTATNLKVKAANIEDTLNAKTIKGVTIDGSEIYVTGQGAENGSALYLYKGDKAISDNQVGFLSFDSKGSTDQGNAQERVLLTTEQGVALKIQTYCDSGNVFGKGTGNISITAGLYETSDGSEYCSGDAYVYFGSNVIFGSTLTGMPDVPNKVTFNPGCKVDFTNANVVGLDTTAKFG